MNQKLPEHIELYVQEYANRFNELYPQLAGLAPPASLYAQPIDSTAIFKALDGFAIFYLPQDPDKTRPSIRFLVYDTMPLSQLLQSVTINLIKILLPPSEPIRTDLSNVENLFQLPPDLPLEVMKQAKYRTLNPELMDTVLSQGNQNVAGMVISPVRQLQDGLAVGVSPTRNHIFSPMVSLPDGRVILQYQWLFADILWEPDGLALDADAAINYVEVDLHVLRLGIEAGIPLKPLYENPYEAVARKLLQVCQEFEELLNDPDTDEPDVQAFLEKPSHLFLISPVHQRIFPRKPLGGGKYIPDFTVLRSDGEYHFIEIENPHREIYQPLGEEESAHLNHAITQVRDWLRYVNDNRDTVRREDGLTTIYEPTGGVVAGRDAHLGDIAARRFEFLRSKNRRITLRTYDMLLAEAYAYVETLRSLGGSTIMKGGG